MARCRHFGTCRLRGNESELRHVAARDTRRHELPQPALDRAEDAELAHLGLEGGAFHAEPGGGAAGAAEDPAGVAQDLQDVAALDGVEAAVVGTAIAARRTRHGP